MAINPNEDTEFNDALRAHGIIPALPAPPRTPSPPPSPTFSDILNDFTPSELAELADNEEDSRHIESYRRERLKQEKELQKKGRFGRVYPIGRDDWTREVTEGSCVDEPGDGGEGKGTPVVCVLYKDGIPASDTLLPQIHTLAARYPRTKFISIVGDKCIPNLPEERIPMIIVYQKGEVINQVVGWGRGRERRREELEALLLVSGALHPPERRDPDERRKDEDEDSDDDDEEDKTRARATATNGRTQKNIRGQGKNKTKDDDSDSEFEFDL
ncbi:Proteolipid protein 2 [Paramarasmius palmivorus]|uniref:Proteolipid protein 2 n=1 Tax=Paramarasmius palmivorus TaxID=297713 RepID=A0AAW0DE12_9AGAR